MTLAEATWYSMTNVQTLFSGPGVLATAFILSVVWLCLKPAMNRWIDFTHTLTGRSTPLSTQTKERLDAARLALSSPLLLGAVSGLLCWSVLGFEETQRVLSGTRSFVGWTQGLVLVPAFLASLSLIGTLRQWHKTFGGSVAWTMLPVALLGTACFFVGLAIAPAAAVLVLLREGRWTPHLVAQAPWLGWKRLQG